MMQLTTRFFLTWLALTAATWALAQPYVEGGNTRHRFAQMTVGADFLFVPSGGEASAVQDGQLTTYAFPSRLQPRLSIGGTHFWGHAEFYVAFDLANLLPTEVAPGIEYRTSAGIETAFKVYPWRLEHGKLRPFVGSGMSVPNVRLRQDGSAGRSISETIIPLMAGFTYQRNSLLWEVGARYRLGEDFPYYINRDQPVTLQPARFGLFAGVRFQFETTLSAEAPYEDGRTDYIVKRLREMNRLSGFSVAVGPSASFNLRAKRSTYNRDGRAFLDNHEGGGIFPEFGLGYYYAPWDAHVNLAYRGYTSQVSAYAFRQRARRRSVTLEAYKFLGDYHGFVPFVGPSISYDRWALTETDDGTEVHSQQDGHWLPGISFGWDIRPDKAQWFILRTNLRYTPFQMSTPGNTQLTLDQLEFNFIQLVIYPSRMLALRNM